MSSPEAFFEFARKRHQIYLDRKAGRPPPWTDDPILDKYRFTNVFRELDRVTVWFRENVRDGLADKPEAILATLVFRMFNRITTGEAIFLQRDLHDGHTAWEWFLTTGGVGVLKDAIRKYCGFFGPFVTGSYIIKTPEGMDKLDGVLWIIRQFVLNSTKHDGEAPPNWRSVGEHLLANPGEWTMERFTNWLENNFAYIGWFTAYEVACDLRYTRLLDQAPDRLTWANPGPGATRGMNAVMGRDPTSTPSRLQLIREMQELLAASRQHWPVDWPAWEMREVEHTLCEFYKYEKARLGTGRPRGRFR